MYSTNTSFSCCLLCIIIVIYSVNDRYGYVACIGSCIDWEIASIIFKGLLIMMQYLGCSFILFYIWPGQNSSNSIAYAFSCFIPVCFIFWHDSQFVYSTLIWRTYFMIPPCLVHPLLISFKLAFHFLNLKFHPAVDSVISLSFTNSLSIFKIRLYFTLVNVSIFRSNQVPCG